MVKIRGNAKTVIYVHTPSTSSVVTYALQLHASMENSNPTVMIVNPNVHMVNISAVVIFAVQLHAAMGS
jgi:hypothetical protein